MSELEDLKTRLKIAKAKLQKKMRTVKRKVFFLEMLLRLVQSLLPQLQLGQ